MLAVLSLNKRAFFFPDSHFVRLQTLFQPILKPFYPSSKEVRSPQEIVLFGDFFEFLQIKSLDFPGINGKNKWEQIERMIFSVFRNKIKTNAEDSSSAIRKDSEFSCSLRKKL